MLLKIRENSKNWATFIVVAIVIFMLGITGLETLSPSSRLSKLAEVNSDSISRSEFLKMFEYQKKMFLQRMGKKFDESVLDESLIKKQVMDQLIDRALLLQAVQNGKMYVDDKQVDRLILNSKEFHKDGKFDKEAFQKLISNAGLTIMHYRNMLKQSILLEQLQIGIVGSEFQTDYEYKQFESLQQQKRDIELITFEAKELINHFEISEEQIESYYNNHHSSFMSEEKVSIQYVKIDKEKIKESINVSEDELQQEYRNYINNLKLKEQERYKVATILLSTKNKDYKLQKQLAQNIVDEVKKGASFSKLAKKNSDDPITSQKGGDMGYVELGYYGKNIDNTIKSLSINEVSKPIETDYGIQIFQLTDIKKAEVPGFSDIKENIGILVKDKKANDLFINQVRSLADVSYEASDLTQPAEKLGLSIHETRAFSRSGNGNNITSNPEVIKQAFSKEVLMEGANSDLIELNNREALVLRAQQYFQSTLKPLDVVKNDVIEILKKHEVEKALLKKMNMLLVQLNDSEKQKEELKLNWHQAGNISRYQKQLSTKVLNKVFSMSKPDNSKPTYDFIEQSNGDFVLIKLKAVNSLLNDAKNVNGPDASFKKYLAFFKGQESFRRYTAGLKKSASIKINKVELEKI